MKKMFTRIIYISFLLTSCFIIFIAFIVIDDNFNEKKFDKVIINSDVDIIKEIWGNPNENFVINDQKRVLIYNGWSKDYVFVFNNDNAKLIGKYTND